MPGDELKQRIAEIRERRAKMDQFGPLSVGLTPGSHRSFVIVKGDAGLEANCGVVGERNSAKADFFANAPADIDVLIAEIERLQEQWDTRFDTLCGNCGQRYRGPRDSDKHGFGKCGPTR